MTEAGVCSVINLLFVIHSFLDDGAQGSGFLLPEFKGSMSRKKYSYKNINQTIVPCCIL